MAVVAVAGDDLIAVDRGHLHADDDRFLADIEVAEAADQAHAVELPRLLLEAADQQHLAVGVEVFLAGELGRVRSRRHGFRPGFRPRSMLTGWPPAGFGSEAARPASFAASIGELPGEHLFSPGF